MITCRRGAAGKIDQDRDGQITAADLTRSFFEILQTKDRDALPADVDAMLKWAREVSGSAAIDRDAFMKIAAKCMRGKLEKE